MLDSDMPRFLVIDDDETLLQVTARGLRRRGFDVYTAQTGEQAIQLCAAHPPKFISLDLKLQDETGLHLIPELLHQAPEAKIVMLTAYGSIATAVNAIKQGAHHYLCKPVDIDQLLAAFEAETEVVNDEPHQPTSVKRLEWERIQLALQNNDGNVSATARELGMHRRTLQRKLQKHPVKK